MPVRVVLDCDTGTDDAVAVLCAVLDPRVELLAVTTVWGNHDVRDTTDNTLRTLDLVGAGDVPVVPGLNGPYAGRVTPLPSGRDDIPTRLALPPATSTAGRGTAPALLAGLPEGTTVVTTGPLSNLAAALAADRGLAARLGRVVCLAGSHEVDGVAPLVERNAWCDPEALAAVLAAGVRDLTLVGMDATFSAPLDEADAARLRAVGTPAAEAAAGFVEQRLGWYDGPAPLHDPLALAAVVEPGLLTTRRASARVELDGGPAYGRTVLDWAGDRLRFAVRADHDGYLDWLCRVLGGVLGRPSGR